MDARLRTATIRGVCASLQYATAALTASLCELREFCNPLTLGKLCVDGSADFDSVQCETDHAEVHDRQHERETSSRGGWHARNVS